MARVRQKLYGQVVADVEAEVIRQIESSRLATRLRPGGRIAIAAGSRGIANIARVVAATAEAVRRLGGQPFVVPAMGSHGGGTAAGQTEILASLGITEESCRCPVLATMDVVQLGTTVSGLPAYLDRNAAAADGIVVVNRVKKHTDFRSDLESGLMKMICIGLGKKRQADLVHSYGAPGLVKYVPEVARTTLASGKIALGLAIVENGYDETAEVLALEPEEIEERERCLLDQSKAHSPRIPFDDLDLLILDQIGKDVSGTGMDTNVVGRMRVPGVPEPETPRVRTLVALSLTESSHGNAIGLGLADIISQRLVDAMDREVTYVNGITSGFLDRVKIPVTLPTDRQAVEVALSRLSPEAAAHPRVVRIQDTLRIAEMDVSEALLEEAGARDLDIVGPARPLRFDERGTITPFQTELEAHG
jgi:hypothetical protein